MRGRAVLGPLARELGGLVSEEIVIGAPFLAGIPQRLVGVGAQHKDEEVRGNRLPDRIRLRECRIAVPARELSRPTW